MNNIPVKLKNELFADPYYKVCARKAEGGCDGRVTWEHALMYANKQVQEKFAIVPLCVEHHLGGSLNKKINIRLALSRATPEDLKKYPNQTWEKQSR